MNTCFFELTLTEGFCGQMSLGNFVHYIPFLEIKKKKHISILNAPRSLALNIFLDCLIH